MAHRNRTQGRVWKWLGTAIGILLLAAIPLQALAVTFDELKQQDGNLSVNDLQAMFGEGEIPCSATGPADITESNADQVGVEIGGVPFRLDHVFKYDRQAADDSFDFIFTPTQGQDRLRQPAFVYRSGKEKSNGLVLGLDQQGKPVVDNGYAVEGQMVVASCTGLDDLFKALDKQANDEGVKALNVTNAPVTGDTTNFLDADGESDDPFTMALQKMNEFLSSLNTSLVSALKSVMEMSDITEIDGLTDAWTVVRDLVNLLFILILGALAILTILRIEPAKYNVRSLLPLLIFSVIAVNFGLLLARVLIDTAFVLSQPFIDAAKKLIDVQALSSAGSPDAAGFGAQMVLILAQLIMIIGLLVLLFFFIVRIIVVWLLAALSPVLFLFLVLPLTRGEASKLLSTWIKWTYMAPVAFLILFIAAQVLNPGSGFLGLEDSNGDSGASAILRAIFFAGVLVAAVLIPYGLGGRVMALAASQGMRGARLGGKGVGALSTVTPAGGGKTVAQRMREGKAFFEQRKSSQEQDAQMAAAHSRIALAQRLNELGPGAEGITRSITGMSQGQQVAALEEMVGRAQKEMVPLSISSKLRIASAYKYGTSRGPDGQIYALTQNEQGQLVRNESAPMDAKELELSQNRINAAAAFRELGQAEFIDPHFMRGDRNFAWTGYQQLHKTDPVVSSFERSGDRINTSSMRVKAKLMSTDDLRGLDSNVLSGAMDTNNALNYEYREVLRNIDAIRLGDAVDANARNKFHDRAKADKLYELAKARRLSKGMKLSDFHGDTKAYNAELRKQREKEDIIVDHYEKSWGKFKGDAHAP